LGLGVLRLEAAERNETILALRQYPETRTRTQMQQFFMKSSAVTGVACAVLGMLWAPAASATSSSLGPNAGIDIDPRPGAYQSADKGLTRVSASGPPVSTQGDQHRMPLALLHEADRSAPTGRVTPPAEGAIILSRFDLLLASAAHDLQAELHKNRFADLINAPDFDALDAYYDAHGFSLVKAGRSVETPPLLVNKLPPTLAGGRDIPRRKRIFISLMLPHVLAANAEIMDDRQRLEFIISSFSDPTGPGSADIAWLFQKFADYGVKDFSTDRLLARMDIIPPALAIAQAAKESGWGGSRFAQAGNALYGQWTWNPAHKGIVPRERPKGKTYRVRAFDNVLEATRAYMLNLNANRAYGGLRERRQQIRRAGKPLTGIQLTEKLEGYSAIGKRYVRALKSLIRNNKLTSLNSATLGADFMPSRVPVPPAPGAARTIIASN
jgi:Bax protein